MQKDLLLITGANTAGKSSTIKFLSFLCEKYSVTTGEKPVSDAQAIVSALQEDDKNGGLNHYHPWTDKLVRGHSHNNNEPLFPFTVFDNSIPEKMYITLFKKLNSLPFKKALTFVELAGGKNVLPSSHPSSVVDHSYQKVLTLLNENKTNSLWLKRVKAVFHLYANNSLRTHLNKSLSLPIKKDIEKGIASWPKHQDALDIYGEDDFTFSGMDKYLTSLKVPVYHIENNGTEEFYKKLEDIFIDIIKKEASFDASIPNK